MSFLGMRGTNGWASGQRPESYHEALLYLYPNGMAPLTAMLSMMKKVKIDDPVRHWFTKKLQSRSGAVTGVYTDAGLVNPYSPPPLGASGDILYVKMSADTVSHFTPGSQVLLRVSSDMNVDVNGKVLARVSNGANSYLKVELRSSDTGSPTHDLSDTDTILRIGNINPEGSYTPVSLKYDPVEFSNNCQIFRTSADMSRTAMLTRLRTGDPWKEEIREALLYHGVDIEMALFNGKKSSTIGENGQPERTMDGIFTFIKQYNPAGVHDYTVDTEYAGKTWLQGGKNWLNKKLELFFRYDEPEGLAFCGSGALLGIQDLADTYGQISLQPGQKDFGIEVTTWRTVFGLLHLKTHPLFSYETTNQNIMVAMRPKNLTYAYITDTKLEKDVQIPGVDGKVDCYLTECTMEYHHPESFALFYGVGKDNIL